MSDPAYFPEEANVIEQLFDAGLSVFHLRKPGSDRQAYRNLITEIHERYHDRVALHHFHDLLSEFKAIKRLHYPESNRKQMEESEDFEEPVLRYCIRSTSIHNSEELEELKGFDYTFYGPVFNSISKPGYQGIAAVDTVLPKRKSNVEVIALGGIAPEKTEQLKRMGFDGMAVLGAIWKDKTRALSNFKKMLTAVQRMNIEFEV